MNSISNLKKYVFPFIMMFTLIIFGAQGLMNVTNAASDRVVSISKDTDVSTISLKDKSILKLGKDINSSFDLSKLPAVTEKTSIVIDIREITSTKINFTGKLPDNYELPLVIADVYSSVTFSEKSYIPSFYYPNKGTEKNPDVLVLYASEFDLSLLPDKDSKTYLCIMDMCETTGIDFGDSVLPKNYDVSQIFILNEKDRQTFEKAFTNKKEKIFVRNREKMIEEFVKLFTIEDTSKNDTKTTSDSSEKTSSNNSNSNTNKTNSNKTTGDDLNSIYFLGGTFILFSAISLLFRKKSY